MLGPIAARSLQEQLELAIEMLEQISKSSHIAFKVCATDGSILYTNRLYLGTFGTHDGEIAAASHSIAMDFPEPSITPIHGKSGIVLGYFHAYRPREGVKALRKEQGGMPLFDRHPNCVVELQTSGHIRSANPAALQMTGYSWNELHNREYLYLFPARSRDTVAMMLEEAKRGIAGEFECAVFSKDGEMLQTSTLFLPVVLDHQVTSIYCISKDITEQKRVDDQVAHMAYHDPLTNLPNRRLFREQANILLERAGEAQEKAAILLVDLDGFKQINDTYGHTVGDQALQIAAKRLLHCLRDIDIISRMGGDEFTIFLPHLNHPQHAEKVANRIITELNKPYFVRGLTFNVSGSVGIAIYPNDGESVDTLIRHADSAMYRVKDQGKNSFGLYSKSDDQQPYRQRMEYELLEAVRRNQFVLHYQPQFDVENGSIVGVESLIRWDHPERGLVYPGEFIPFAEQSDLILAIGEWVLRRACLQGKEWYDRGHRDLRMAVNLSTRQLQQEDIVERITAILKETGLPPSSLDLEITESIAIQNPDAVIMRLQALASLGVQISVDDFGTGFSSLSYLKLLPIHKIKIDRSFIHDISNRTDAAIVSSIIALANNLNLKVVVEGVETSHQRECLPKLGCSTMQGFYFSKPLPPENITGLLQ